MQKIFKIFFNTPQTQMNNSGQVGVIVLLTMTGMLALGLSLASRTTQEAFLAGKETQSNRVFNAAEQGIETALSEELDFSGELYEGDFDVNGLGVDYSIEKINQLETRLFEGITVGVDVTGAADGNELTIQWSRLDDCATEDVASLVATVYYDDAGVTRVRHEAIGGCDRSDGFTLGSSIDINGYKREYALPLQSGDFLVRLRSIYNDAHVKVASSDFTMPIQYYSIRSSATNAENSERRAVEVNRTLESAPAVLDYALYSQGAIVK